MPSNVILVVADTLSAFNMGYYGYEKNTTPFLDSLAEENFVANYGYSTAPWTVPAHASLFTGDLPNEHGTTSQDIFFSEDSLAEKMKARGYSTVGITNNALLSPEIGFDRGFEEFLFGEEIPMEYRNLETLEDILQKERSGEFDSRAEKYFQFILDSVKRRDFSSLISGGAYLKDKLFDQQVNLNPDSGALYTNELFKDRLRESKNSFVFLNYMEPHEPYNPPKEIGQEFVSDYRKVQENYLSDGPGTNFFDLDLDPDMIQGIRGLYDAEIRYFDSRMEELWNFLDEELDDFVFIFVGDHGENLGHYGGIWGHQFGIWERLVRVPVIIAGPSIPDFDLEENMSIRELHDFVLGEKDISDLGDEEVFAEYYGADGFFKNFDEMDSEQIREKYGNLAFNRSKMKVRGRRGLISSTRASDFPFLAKKGSFSEEGGDHGIKPDLEADLNKKFDMLLEEIDL